MITRPRHPSFEQLADLVEGHLTADAAARLRAHVADCARCAREVAGLERLIGALRADQGEDAPEAVIARAVRLFRPPVRAAVPSLRERLVAALRVDSAARPPAFGLRTTSPAPRQLLYGAGAYDLDVHIAPSGERWALAGQLLGPGSARRAELRGAAGAVEATVSEQGEFVLPPVVAGQYTLRVVLDAADIEVLDLQLGA